jgi:hypothetical protein
LISRSDLRHPVPGHPLPLVSYSKCFLQYHAQTGRPFISCPVQRKSAKFLLQCLHQSICFVSANDAALSRQERKLFSFTYLAAPYVLFGTPPVSVWLSDSRKKEVNTMLNPIMSSSWILMPTIHWWTSDSDMTCLHVCPSPSGFDLGLVVAWTNSVRSGIVVQQKLHAVYPDYWLPLLMRLQIREVRPMEVVDLVSGGSC